MQVHQPACLVLGDLDVRDPRELPQPLLRDPEHGGEVTGEVDGRAPPQLPERVVPDHRGLVVEALNAQRLAEARVVLVVHLAAGERTPCSQTCASRRGRQRLGLPSLSSGRVCTCPKLGAVRVANTNGCALTRSSGTPLPPRMPAPIRW